MQPSYKIRSNYSASVDLRLEVNGQQWPLAKTGHDHFVPATPFELPPCDGVIVVSVDGNEHRSKVRLVNGVRPDDLCVQVERYQII
jgi:hypothetical protein